MGIYSTLYAVIFVHTEFGLPILTLLFRNYFASLPEELFKAARVMGRTVCCGWNAGPRRFACVFR